jgi:SAM-dependent methyltransferase
MTEVSLSVTRPLQQPDLHASTEVYARRFAGPAGQYLLDVQTHALRCLVAPWPRASVIDVGGGHGQVAAPLAAAGHAVTVLASDAAAFGRARLIASEKVALAVGELTSPPFPEQTFQIAIALRLMAHVQDWRTLVHGLCRSASRAVIVDFPIPGGSNSLIPFLFGMKKRLEGDTRRFAVMAKSEVERAFAENGFTVDAAIGQFVLPMALHRGLNMPWASRALEAPLRGCGLAHRFGTPVIMRAVRTDCVERES